jgi:hypothetical protein
MRTFSAGSGKVHALAYGADARLLVVDLRGEPTQHPWMGFPFQPARELVWWDWSEGAACRRFRLRDSLYGPGGALAGEDDRGDWSPDSPAFDVSFRPGLARVATAWEWTNKEDGVCVFDVDSRAVVHLRTPYKTHALRLALAPDGGKFAVATVNDMDGSSSLEVWNLAPEPAESENLATQGALGSWQAWRRERIRDQKAACANPYRPLGAMTFDGRFVAVCGEEATLLIWDSSQAAQVGGEAEAESGEDEWPEPPEVPRKEIGYVPRCLAFAPGSALLAGAGERLGVHDLTANRWVLFNRSGPPVSATAFAVGGRRLLAGNTAGGAELWDVTAGRLLRAFDWGRGPVTAVAISREGDTCAAGTETGEVIVWDLDA